MSQSPQAENDAARARLKALVARLSDADLARPIGHSWTVAAALAHLAFWDRRALVTLQGWERQGVPAPAVDADRVNEAMLPEWLAMTPREAADEAIASAEAVDQAVAALSPELLASIGARRPRAVDRSLHRQEHLDEIARVLAG